MPEGCGKDSCKRFLSLGHFHKIGAPRPCAQQSLLRPLLPVLSGFQVKHCCSNSSFRTQRHGQSKFGPSGEKYKRWCQNSTELQFNDKDAQEETNKLATASHQTGKVRVYSGSDVSRLRVLVLSWELSPPMRKVPRRFQVTATPLAEACLSGLPPRGPGRGSLCGRRSSSLRGRHPPTKESPITPFWMRSS